MDNLRQIFKNINIQGSLGENEVMAKHTTFKVGGPADFFAVPANTDDLRTLLGVSRQYQIPRFILGGGANIVVSDAGIRGLVIDMSKFTDLKTGGNIITAGAGWTVSNLSETAASRGYSGMEFLFAMPGSLGGAVWMNARCYGSSVSDILISVTIMDDDGTIIQVPFSTNEWDYKQSPFQTRSCIILDAAVRIIPGDSDEIFSTMRNYEADRRIKGHFTAPSAGSVFKNNRTFGRPSGQMLDELGLKGTTVGGARLSPQHANIIINTGRATAADIRALTEYLQRQAAEKLKVQLEPEIRFIGDWGKNG